VSSAPVSTSSDVKRRFERMARGDRLRVILAYVGGALLSTGLLLLLLPFGPSLSNLDLVQVDPKAGLSLLQSLKADPARWIGGLLAVVGVVVLGFAVSVGLHDLRGGNGDGT
jgi:hypothetical protein